MTQPSISQTISDILTGYYNRKRMTQEDVAARSGMSVVTVQKKLKGKAPITATDLVILSQAIGVDPTVVLAEAIKENPEGGANPRPAPTPPPVSEPPVSLTDHRQKKSLAEMTDEELEGELSVANTDPEIGLDEPDLP